MRYHIILSIAFVLLAFTFAGCVKVIAGEEELTDKAYLHNQRIGASAKDLLRADRYTALRVEIQYMEGFEPDKASLYNLQIFLQQYLDKPDGIYLEVKQIDPAADKILNRENVLGLERSSRSVYTNGKELGLYILYTNGRYINEKIAGLAYRNTSAVLFGQMIKDHSGRIGQPDRTKLETTVLLHEVGHLLGLINKGSDMLSDHQDEDHHGHCSNKECLMYYRIGTDDRFAYLVKGKIPELDVHCQADLQAIRN
ncbi:hypothetical protein [Cnuella takakiae]|nr:hypothetical protein [Cnuella takakiae]OLY93239.1 hypothetical protein BUE76_16115 [Cnuella takakiae]